MRERTAKSYILYILSIDRVVACAFCGQTTLIFIDFSKIIYSNVLSVVYSNFCSNKILSKVSKRTFTDYMNYFILIECLNKLSVKY